MNLILHTERLTLAPLSKSDLDIVTELFTNPKVVEYAGAVMEEAAIRAEILKWTRRGGNGCIGIWCVKSRDSGEKLGTGALLPMPIDEDNTDFDLVVSDQMPDADIEIGYFLKPSAWRKGFATEICRRLVRFAFKESPLEEVVASFDPGNEPSRNVLAKSGFEDRGMRRCYGEESPDYRITREGYLRYL